MQVIERVDDGLIERGEATRATMVKLMKFALFNVVGHVASIEKFGRGSSRKHV